MTKLAPEHRQLLAAAYRELRYAQQQLAAAEAAATERIAIVGMALRLPPDLADAEAAWSAFRHGVDGVSRLTTLPDGTRAPGDERTPPAGMLADVAGFDAGFFQISEAEAAKMDPQQRLMLQLAWEALEDAGIPLPEASARTTGVYVGVYQTDYLTLQLKDPTSIDAYTAPGCALSMIANRTSYLFNLSGPSLVVDTACSSSLTALHLAVQALRTGDCDLALVGGVNLITAPESTRLTGRILPTASSGRCRSFDADGDGIVRGEGGVVLVLERAGRAAEAGRRVWSLIRGSAVNQDGRTNGLTAPNPRAQREVINRALAAGKVDPAEVVYIEAHGTGTSLGDPIEMESLKEVYGQGTWPCRVGSVKAQIGHLEAAAGLAGLVRATLVLRHGEVPAQMHFTRLNPEISLSGTRLSVPETTSPLPDTGSPRLAAVSSFGFGGANAHVILQEPTPAPRGRSAPARSYLLPLSARDAGALAELAGSYRRLLAAATPERTGQTCAAAAVRRTHHRYRRAVAARSPEELRELLAEPFAASECPPTRPQVGFVFSGQGVQWAGMADALHSDDYLRAELELCDELVRRSGGWSLLEALGRSDGGRLTETAVAQVAIASVQLGLARRLAAYGVTPDVVVGHSMGELVAASVAGALSRAELIELLLVRAELAERARGGRMALLRLPEPAVRDLLAELVDGDDAAVAAVNSPTATVVSGSAQAVDRLVSAADRRGVRTRLLPVDYAFHGPALAGLHRELARRLAYLPARTPRRRFLSSVTGGRWGGALDVEYWGRNLCDPVRFADAVAALAPTRPTVLVEVGPHPALLADLRQIVDAHGWRGVRLLPTLRRDRDPWLCLDETLAGLYEWGYELDWTARYPAPVGDVPLPRYPWRQRRLWSAPAPVGHAPAPAAGSNGRHVAAPAPVADRHRDAPPVAVAGPTERDLVEAIRRRCAAILGLAPAQIDPDQPLQDYDLESIQVVELRNQLEKEFSLTVPLDVMLAGGSPNRIARSLLGTAAPTPAAALDRAQAERLLDRLDQLSDEEVEAALAALSERSIDGSPRHER